MSSWQQTSTGRFERPLDHLEKFFVAIGTPEPVSGKEPFSINLLLKTKFDPSLGEPLQALKKGWADVRLRYPEIVATQDGTNKCYEPLKDAAALQAWVDATCFEEARTPQAVITAFKAGEQMSLRYFPASGEILLHAPHYLIDGLACIFLLDHILTAATSGPSATVVPGQEQANLQPPVEKVAGLVESAEINEQAMNMFLGMAGAMPSVGMSSNATKDTPVGTAYATVRLSPATTAALIAACKKADVGITAAMHAALIKCVGKYDEAKKYVSVLRVNMRPYLPAPYNSNSYPLNPCVSGTPAALDTSTAYTALAQQVQTIYSDRTVMGNVLRYLKGWVHTLLSNPPPPGTPGPANPDFNSLGLIDRLLKPEYPAAGGAVQVLDFWHGSEQLGSNQELYMWTFRDQLNLLACFNAAVFSPTAVEAYLEEAVTLLCSELGVARSST